MGRGPTDRLPGAIRGRTTGKLHRFESHVSTAAGSPPASADKVRLRGRGGGVLATLKQTRGLWSGEGLCTGKQRPACGADRRTAHFACRRSGAWLYCRGPAVQRRCRSEPLSRAERELAVAGLPCVIGLSASTAGESAYLHCAAPCHLDLSL